MTYRVLLPVDDSERSRDALDYVTRRHADDTVTALHVLDPSELTGYGGIDEGEMIAYDEMQAQQHESGERLLEDTRERAENQGLDIATALETGPTEQTIIDYVEDHDIDHVVIGSHGRTGVSRILLGSVAEKVARRSPVPVTIVR